MLNGAFVVVANTSSFTQFLDENYVNENELTNYTENGLPMGVSADEIDPDSCMISDRVLNM